MGNLNSPSILLVQEIEMAAALECKGHGAAVWEAGEPGQAFAFIDDLSLRESIRKIEDEGIDLNDWRISEAVEKLEDFVKDSIEMNAEFDAANRQA